MPTPQDTKRDAMAKVNSVMAAINLYPSLDTTNTQLSFSSSANPIDLLVDFFKSTKGYDWLIDKVSDYIVYAIPVLEVTVKGVLLSNIRIMLSCSINPLITAKMIRDGVVFDLNQTDLLNIFNFSPLDKSEKNMGRYFYFGCNPEDGIEIIDDVKKSRDFNAVLWYCKNTPGERVVWKRNKDVNKPDNLHKSEDEDEDVWLKQVKSNGIATIEFNGRAGGLTNAVHNGMYIQEPISNCIHVFIGNTTPVMTGNPDPQTTLNSISTQTKLINQYNQLKQDLTDIEKRITQGKVDNRALVLENGASQEALDSIEQQATDDYYLINRIRYSIEGIDIAHGKVQRDKMVDIVGDVSSRGEFYTTFDEFGTIHEALKVPNTLMETTTVKAQAEKIRLLTETESFSADYPSVESNYYYRRPLFEWNTDYIMSMKLFDPKVVTAQLLDALTKCLQFNGGISITPQMQFVQNQMRDLVTKIIETDEGTVSDCFFSFTNDSYNALINEVELNRANLYTTNGQTINEVPSAEEILDSLNTLSQDASKEELKSAISGSVFSAVGGIKAHGSGQFDASFGFQTKFSIIDNLLTQLTNVIVMTVIQPKIYVLLMANLKFLGNEPNFDLAKFIQQFRDLISQIIKEIRDSILEFFKKELIDVLKDLTKNLAISLTLEQYKYYISLLTHCIDCFKIHQNDWSQDDVRYADITELTQEENQEC